MTLKYTVLSVAIIGLVNFGDAVGGSFPVVTGAISNPECAEAFELAKSMFRSKASRVYAPLILPPSVRSELVLGATAMDISGGNAIEPYEESFGGSDGYRAKNGIRFEVTTAPLGWRGYQYSLRLIDESHPREAFQCKLPHCFPVVQESWRPPLIFRTPEGRTWIVVVGEPYQILADWSVYVETPSRFESACSIAFRPSGEEVTGLFPQSVQRLAKLLDGAIGPGRRDEGTLQSTARLRLQVNHVWANAALRPWALSEGDTYNSTSEVKAGLDQWSENGHSYRQAKEEIDVAYAPAERDLGDYYRHHFDLPAAKANGLAKWVLDIVFRAHFTFPNGGDYFRYDNVNTNPWAEDFKD